MNRLLALVATLQLLIIMAVFSGTAHAADSCQSYRKVLTQAGQEVYGLDAPIPMFIGQLRQESSCRDNVTAWDFGRGAAQFMDGTAKMVANRFPELGPPDPYNRTWAVRAMVRLDYWNESRVKGKDTCHKRAAALKGYNAGLGYVQQAQKASPDPTTWFGVTEYIPTRQSAQNFEYSRTYPQKILFKHQPLYADWGVVTCPGMKPTPVPVPKGATIIPVVVTPAKK